MAQIRQEVVVVDYGLRWVERYVMEPVTTNRLSERHIVTIVATHKSLRTDTIKHAQIHAKGLFTCNVF